MDEQPLHLQHTLENNMALKMQWLIDPWCNLRLMFWYLGLSEPEEPHPICQNSVHYAGSGYTYTELEQNIDRMQEAEDERH